MKNFFEWFQGQEGSDLPWLILGKGPSFDQRHRYDLQGYRLLSLNHVVREQPVMAAHMIDIDVVFACAESIESNAQVLVMPWVPHVKNLLGTKTLAQWVAESAVLQRLSAAGRLLWYDLSTSKERHGTHPVVRATSFSAEAALHLLALAGVRRIRSLGVDGGASYGQSFDDLKNVTRLNNGHASYDLQFEGFARTLLATGVDFAPLDIESPIRVYVGSQEEQMLALRVLEYSIRRHTSMTTQVLPLHTCGIEFPMPRDRANWPRTPFSFQRFTIPMLAGHRGRAVYLDSDMQVFRDMRALWTLPFDGADLLAAREAADTSRRPQFSVMLLDCERLAWTPATVIEALDSGRLTYAQLMYEMALATRVHASIPPEWNSLERYEAGRTCLLHYTDMNTQPWVHRGNPRGWLWVRELASALKDGFITMDEVHEHVNRGWVRPSILGELSMNPIRWPLHPLGWWRDRAFVPPYKRMPAAAPLPASPGGQ
jgi:hypothetical protein